MVSNQEDFTTLIEDKVISPKQLDNFYRKRDESFYNKESLTSIWRFTSVWIFQAETSSKSCEDWTELIFSPPFPIPGSLHFSAFLTYILPRFSIPGLLCFAAFLAYKTSFASILYSWQVPLRVVPRLYFASFL